MSQMLTFHILIMENSQLISQLILLFGKSHLLFYFTETHTHTHTRAYRLCVLFQKKILSKSCMLPKVCHLSAKMIEKFHIVRTAYDLIVAMNEKV